MTAAFFRGRRQRAAAAVGAVTFGLVALSACDKPTPLATVTVGSTTVTSEAACYEDGERLDNKALGKCLAEGSPKTIKVKPGEKVRVGVDTKLADKGWMVLSNGASLTDRLKLSYTSLDNQNVFYDPRTRQAVPSTLLSVITSDGVWNFKLETDNG